MTMVYYLALLGACLLLLTCVMLEPDVLEEYCEIDIFQARCATGVILMEQARFGRMALGRCLMLDVGFMDCFSDVLPEMDRLCSGQPTCDVRVNDLAILTQPCPLEFRSYLEARYTCISVVSPGPHCCRSHNDQIIDAGNGYIASIVTTESGCGASNCPWKIRASNSQKIDLHILDFGYSSTQENDQHDYMSSGKCRLYAIINEVTVGYTLNVCAGTERRRHLYTTASNSVDVTVVVEESEWRSQQKYFILGFEALGCADPIPPKHGTVKRHGDHASVTCLGQDDTTWDIVCHEGQWTGSYGNCSTGSSQPGNSDREPPSQWTRFQFSVAIIIIVVVAVTVAMVLLIIGIVCIVKTYSRPAQGAQQTQQQYGGKSLDISYPAERYKDEQISLYSDDNYVNPRYNNRNLPVAVPNTFAQTICLTDRGKSTADN